MNNSFNPSSLMIHNLGAKVLSNVSFENNVKIKVNTRDLNSKVLVVLESSTFFIQNYSFKNCTPLFYATSSDVTMVNGILYEITPI
jgi:hypothetical protein